MMNAQDILSSPPLPSLSIDKNYHVTVTWVSSKIAAIGRLIGAGQDFGSCTHYSKGSGLWLKHKLAYVWIIFLFSLQDDQFDEREYHIIFLFQHVLTVSFQCSSSGRKWWIRFIEINIYYKLFWCVYLEISR